MMAAALVLFGIIGLARLPVRELPDVDPPVVNVTTVYPGAAAEVVETEVTEPLEESINSIEGIKIIDSESREQVSSISVEFSLSRDIDIAAQDVRDRVARVRGRLPDDTEEPVIAKQSSDANPFLWIALFSDRYSTQEMTTIAENIMKDPLQTVSGVSSVFIGGSKRWAMRLWLDPAKMTAHGVTVLDVERALRSQNLELPSGRVENVDRLMTIQTLGELKDVEEFNRLVIREDGDKLTRLADIGYAEHGVESYDGAARYNGKPAVGLGVVRQSKANTIEVADGIMAELERLKPYLPEGIDLFMAYDESTYIRKSIREVWNTLGIAFVLVVLTVFMFLQSIRTTFIPCITIPAAITATFGLLYLMGFTINIITMMALVLTIGVVVDDSIVVLENIYRHIEEGEDPMSAAINGMREIIFAVIATTVSLAVVFLPMALQTSLTGRIFIEFAYTMAGSVVVSSFIALTFTPALAARLLRARGDKQRLGLFGLFERVLSWVTRVYGALLGWFLRHRWVAVVIAIVVVSGAAWFFDNLEQEFMPNEDKGRLLCIAFTPEGSTSQYTLRMVKKMENIVSDVPETAGFFSAVALAREGPGRTNQGFMFVRFEEDRQRRVQDILEGPRGLGARFFSEVEGAIAIPILPKAIGGGMGQSFQLVIKHPDMRRLDTYAQELTNRLRGEGYLQNLRTNFKLNKPEVRLTIDRDRAGTLGVSVSEISRTLQILFGGQDITSVKREGKEYEVMVQLEPGARLLPDHILNQYVRGQTGRLVQLGNVVRLEKGGSPNAVFRYNRLRSATIEATPADIPLGTAMARVERILEKSMPDGFRYEWAGEARDLRQTGNEIYLVIAIALIVVYMALAAQFESFLHPLVVMVAIPLASIGAFGTLYLLNRVNDLGTSLYEWTHYAPEAPEWAHTASEIVPRLPSMNINIFSQIGLLLLVALVTKNAILLVEFANQQMKKGKGAVEAMKQAGLIRLRPILMTSFSTIMGIMPIAIGFGVGAESRRPLGVVAVGGMVTATFFTLLIVPVFYVFLTRKSRASKDREMAAADSGPNESGA